MCKAMGLTGKRSEDRTHKAMSEKGIHNEGKQPTPENYNRPARDANPWLHWHLPRLKPCFFSVDGLTPAQREPILIRPDRLAAPGFEWDAYRHEADFVTEVLADEPTWIARELGGVV